MTHNNTSCGYSMALLFFYLKQKKWHRKSENTILFTWIVMLPVKLETDLFLLSLFLSIKLIFKSPYADIFPYSGAKEIIRKYFEWSLFPKCRRSEAEQQVYFLLSQPPTCVNACDGGVRRCHGVSVTVLLRTSAASLTSVLVTCRFIVRKHFQQHPLTSRTEGIPDVPVINKPIPPSFSSVFLTLSHSAHKN